MNKFVEWIIDHPWRVIVVIAVITAVFVAFIPQLKTETDFTEYISRDDPAIAAMEEAEKRYGSQTFFMVAVKAEDSIFNRSTLEKIEKIRKEITELKGVEEVQGPLNSQIIEGKESSILVDTAAPGGTVPLSEKGIEQLKERLLGSRMLRDRIVSSDEKAAALSVELAEDAEGTVVAREIQKIVKSYRGPEGIFIVGLPYMNIVISQSMERDLVFMLPLVILVIVGVLYFSFRSIRGVLLPLLVVLLSTAWSVGLMSMLGVPFTVISFILPVILMAVGIAYCIHVLNKYYEEAARGKGKREVIKSTVNAMTSPVAMAGMTTAAGFLSLISSFLIPQREFGIFTAFGVIMAMVLSLLLLPAVLSLLSLPQAEKNRHDSDDRSGFRGIWGGVLGFFALLVSKRRKTILVVALALFITCIVGTTMVRVETSQVEFLGQGSPVVKGLNLMDRHFSGSEQVIIEVDTGRRDGLKDPEILKKMVELEQWLAEKDGIKINKTISLASLVREMNQKFHGDDPSYYRIPETERDVAQLLFPFTLQSGELGSMAMGDFSAGEIIGFYKSTGSGEVVELSKSIQNYLKESFRDLDVEMVGSTRVGAAIFSKIINSQIISLATSIVAAGVIVVLLMGSAVAGAISLTPLVLTVVINFGIMGFSGTPLDMATLMVSSIAIGIGIDYAIHFMTRFREEYRGDKDPENALRTTLKTTGRGILYNALALALGFAVLLFSTFKGTANFGLLISATMIISSLSAFIVIPALLMTFEPGFLNKAPWYERFGGEEG